MKKSLLLLVCCFIAVAGVAQHNNLFVYGEVGGGEGNFATTKIGINAIYKDFAFGIGHYSQWADAPDVPSDYNTGIHVFGSNKPQQTLSTYCFTAGKVFYTKSKNIRYVAKAGISWGNLELPDTYTKVSYGFMESNYQVAYKDVAALGIVLNPTVEFSLTRHFGFSAGLWANVNTARSTFGVEGNIIFGRLRNWRKPGL